jgi:hypothetical protein
LFFSAADWDVRVREKEHANEPRGPEEVDPSNLGKGFDTGIRYLLEKKFACYVCPVYVFNNPLSSYRKTQLFKYEKFPNCYSVLEERGLLFYLN